MPFNPDAFLEYAKTIPDGYYRGMNHTPDPVPQDAAQDPNQRALAEHYGVPYGTPGLDQAAALDTANQGYFGRMAENFNRQRFDTHTDQIESGEAVPGLVMNEPDFGAESRRQQSEFQNRNFPVRREVPANAPLLEKMGNYLYNLPIDAAGMAGPMAESLAAGAATAAVGAPGAGALAYWGAQGAGAAKNEMEKAGVTPGVATLAALPTGAVYAGIEALQVGHLLPKGAQGKLLGGLAKRLIADKAPTTLRQAATMAVKDNVKESLEEGLQEATMVAGHWAGAAMSPGAQSVGLGEAASRITGATLESVGPLALLGGGKFAGNAYGARQYQRGEEQFYGDFERNLMANEIPEDNSQAAEMIPQSQRAGMMRGLRSSGTPSTPMTRLGGRTAGQRRGIAQDVAPVADSTQEDAGANVMSFLRQQSAQYQDEQRANERRSIFGELMKGGMSSAEAMAEIADMEARSAGINMGPRVTKEGVERAKKQAGPRWRDYIYETSGDEQSAARLWFEDNSDVAPIEEPPIPQGVTENQDVAPGALPVRPGMMGGLRSSGTPSTPMTRLGSRAAGQDRRNIQPAAAPLNQPKGSDNGKLQRQEGRGQEEVVPSTTGAASEVAAAPVRKGEVGGMLSSGEVVLTTSGRETTPFPKIDTSTDRKASNTVRKVDAWLLENAIAEAESRGDNFNARSFRAENAKNLPQASKDSMEEYIFGEQPKVIKSILKPLVSPKPVTPEVTQNQEKEAKAPWQMTRGDWFDSNNSNGKRSRINSDLEHSIAVHDAMGEGLPVPPEVLADYPDLTSDHFADANKMVAPSADQVADAGKPMSPVADREPAPGDQQTGLPSTGEPQPHTRADLDAMTQAQLIEAARKAVVSTKGALNKKNHARIKDAILAAPGGVQDAAPSSQESVESSQKQAPKEKVKIRRYADGLKRYLKGNPTVGKLDADAKREWLQEFGRESHDTGRKLRYEYELSDGRIVSAESALKETNPEAHKRIMERRGEFRSQLARLDVFKALPDDVQQQIVDEVDVDEIVSNALSKNTKHPQFETAIDAYLKENGSILAGIWARSDAPQIVSLIKHRVYMLGEAGMWAKDDKQDAFEAWDKVNGQHVDVLGNPVALEKDGKFIVAGKKSERFSFLQEHGWEILTQKPEVPSSEPAKSQAVTWQQDIDALLPVLDKKIDNETAPHRKLSAATSMMDGEPPEVQKAMALRLWKLSPGSAEMGISKAPIGMRDIFKETKPVSDEGKQSEQAATETKPKPSAADTESRVLSVLTEEGRFIDEIAKDSGLTISETLAAVTLLELKGKVKQFSGKRFALVAKPAAKPTPTTDPAAYQRTTPRKGTPERDAMDAKAEAAQARREESSAKVASLEQERDKTKLGSKKRDSLTTKTADARVASKKVWDETKQDIDARHKAHLEDTAETGDEANRIAAVARLTDAIDAYDKIKPLAEDALKELGISENDAKSEALSIASSISSYPGVQTLDVLVKNAAKNISRNNALHAARTELNGMNFTGYGVLDSYKRDLQLAYDEQSIENVMERAREHFAENKKEEDRQQNLQEETAKEIDRAREEATIPVSKEEAERFLAAWDAATLADRASGVVVYETQAKPNTVVALAEIGKLKKEHGILVSTMHAGAEVTGSEVKLKPVKPLDAPKALEPIVSDEETRLALNGVFYDADKNVVVASNGRMMAILPHKVAGKSRIVRVTETATEKPGTEIDGQFPKYQMVIPKTKPKMTFRLDIDSVRRKMVVAEQINKSVKARSRNDTFPSIAVIETKDGETWLDPQYVRAGVDALLAAGAKEIAVEYHGQDVKPVVLRGDNGGIVIIMPIKTGNIVKAKAILNATATKDASPKLSTVPADNRRGMAKSLVESSTRELFKRWKNAPKPVIVQSVADLPPTLRAKAEAERAAGKIVRGAYDPATDTVYLVADGLRNGHEAAFVAIHEVVGHRGLEAIIPDVTTFYERLAREKGLEDADAAREWLADKAAEWQQEPWWKKLIVMVRKALARLMPGRAWADVELRMLVDDAGRYSEKENLFPEKENLFPAREGAFSTEPSVTPEKDRDYLDAVQRGDMETAQRMVDEAAKAAGYTVYRSTRHKLRAFNDVPWMMFTEDKEASEYYGKNHYVASDKNAVSADDLYQDIVDAIDEEFDVILGEDEVSPADIVDSAGVWDNPDMVQVIWDKVLEPKGIMAIRTNDGLMAMEQDSIVKSADPVTYDDAGNVIPLSQRFNPQSPDIRFSTTTSDDTIPEKPLAALREAMSEAVDALMRQKWFPERVRQEITAARAVSGLEDENARPDLSPMDLLLRTIHHYSEKVPQLRKIYEAAMKISDDKHGFKEIIFGEDHAWLRTMNEYFNVSGMDMARGVLDSEKSKETAARVEEAKRLSAYLWQRDNDAMGYRVEEGPDGWTVNRPYVEDGNIRYEDVATAESETDGWKMAWDLEGEELSSKGFSQAAVDAMHAARRIAHMEYAVLREEADEYEHQFEDAGLDPPLVEGVSIFDALREMGDRRGYWMPRMRKPGRYMAYAFKDGENPVMQKFDIDGGPFVPGTRRHWTAQMRRQGYRIELKQSDNPSEDTMFDTNVVAMNDQFRSVLDRMKGDADVTLPGRLSDLNLKGGYATTKDGKREYVIEGNVRKALKEVFMALGGQYYAAEKGGVKAWHFAEPVRGFEKKLLRALNTQIYGEAMLVDSFGKTFAMDIANMIHARGSRSTKIKRSDATGLDVVQGYEEDIPTAFALSGSSLAGGSAKRRFAQAAMQAITGMDQTWIEYLKNNLPEDTDLKSPEGREERRRIYDEYQDEIEEKRLHSGLQPVAFKEAKEFTLNMLRNDTQMERIVGKIRGYAALKYLSGVSSALINVSSMVTVVPAALKAYGNIGMEKIPRLIGRSSREYLQYVSSRRSGRIPALTGDTLALFDEIHKRGWDAPLMNMEAMNALETWSGRGVRRAMDLMMWAFSSTEQFNRATTIAAAYHGLREQGMGHESALTKAKAVSDKAHAVYGKVNLPAWMRGSDAGSQALRSWYMFKGYAHNWAQILVEMGLQKRDMQAAAYMMFAPMLLAGAGASGLPREWAVKLMRELLRAMGFDMPDDPEMALYDAIGENYGDYARQIAQGGVMGALGVNIQGSLRSDRMVPTNLSELLGAPASIVLDVTAGGVALWNGELLKAGEKLSPRIVSGGFRGAREAFDGVTTPAGKPVYWGDEPLRATPFQFLVRVPGFNPIGLSMKTDQQWNERKTAAQYDEEKSGLYSRLRSMLRSGKVSKGRYAEWLQDVEAWNAQVRTRRPAGVTQITDQTIWFVAEDMKTPPKSESERGENVQLEEARLGVTMEELLRGKAKKKKGE